AERSFVGADEQRGRGHVVPRAPQPDFEGTDRERFLLRARGKLEIVVEAELTMRRAVVQRLHRSAQALLPDHRAYVTAGVEPQAPHLCEALVERDALEPIHVIAVYVRDEHVVNRLERQRAAGARARGAQHAAVAVWTIDGQAKTLIFEQQRRRRVA